MVTMIRASYHMITLSTAMTARTAMDVVYTALSRISGHFSTAIGRPQTARPAHADTPSVLYTPLPTTVPTPRSDLVTKVPITETRSSDVQVAAAMNVAPATSGEIPKSENHTTLLILFILYYKYGDSTSLKHFTINIIIYIDCIASIIRENNAYVYSVASLNN